jgi:hypothetical protein
MVALSTMPNTRTLVPFFTALAGAPWVFVADVSSTVTSTPVAVVMVKPEADVVSTMPVAPPVAGPDLAPPPDPPGGVDVAVGAGVAVVEADDAAAVLTPTTPVTTPISPATTMRPVLFFDNAHGLCGLPAGAVEVGASRHRVVMSSPVMMALLSLGQRAQPFGRSCENAAATHENPSSVT